jgi:hypothetical protein
MTQVSLRFYKKKSYEKQIKKEHGLIASNINDEL